LRTREDFDRVAVAQWPVQRRYTAVDPGTVAVLSDLGMDHEREVERRRALRQPLDIAPRCEDEDLVLIQVDFEELEEFFGAVRVLLQLDQLPEPRKMVVELVGSLAVSL
jgi:hypothetical protein